MKAGEHTAALLKQHIIDPDSGNNEPFVILSPAKKRDGGGWEREYIGECTQESDALIFVRALDQFDAARLKREKCLCGVPKDVHGTMCGWRQANVTLLNGIIVDGEHPYYGRSFNDYAADSYKILDERVDVIKG